MQCTVFRVAMTTAMALLLASPLAQAEPEASSIGGRMFFDLTSQHESSNDGSHGKASDLGVDVKRFYVDIGHQFDPTWTVQLTTDFNWSSSDGETRLFVKKAYLEGKFSKVAVLRIGSADMPWISFVDKVQGFRYIEKSLVDQARFGNSADWGLHLSGKLGESGSIEYAAAMVNGAGYKDPGRSNSVDFEGRLAYSATDHLVLAVGAYSGRRGKDLDASPAIHTARRVNAMAAWISDRSRFGFEYFKSDNWNEINKPAGDRAKGWSIWASQSVGKQFTLTTRYDRSEPSHQRDPRRAASYAHLGVEYRLRKGLDLALVWKQGTTRSTARSNDTDYTREGRGNEIGLWGQVAF